MTRKECSESAKMFGIKKKWMLFIETKLCVLWICIRKILPVLLWIAVCFSGLVRCTLVVVQSESAYKNTCIYMVVVYWFSLSMQTRSHSSVVHTSFIGRQLNRCCQIDDKAKATHTSYKSDYYFFCCLNDDFRSNTKYWTIYLNENKNHIEAIK